MNWIKKPNKSNRSIIPIYLWVSVALLYCFLLPITTYYDILMTAKQGYNIWNLLCEGRIADFYIESLSMVPDNPYYNWPCGANYLFPIYVVFALWNLPTWVLERVTGLTLFDSIPSMIWMKLMLVPFLLWATHLMRRLIVESGREEYADLGAFLFASSILTVYPIGIIGQYDIMSMPFILLGMIAWVQGDRKRFLIFFAVSVFFKYFSLMYYLPLLLTREKKIRRLMADTMLVMLPSILFLLIFPKPAGQGSNVGAMYNLFLTGIEATEKHTIWLFVILLVVVNVFVFFRPKTEKKENEFQFVVYCLMVIMVGFCVLIHPHPYWVILAAPAFSLAVVFSGEHMNKVLILETALGAFVALKNYLVYSWCFSVRTAEAMGTLHKLLHIAPSAGDDSSLLASFSSTVTANSLVLNILLIVSICLLYFASPWCRRNEMWEPLRKETLIGRTAVNAFVAFLPIAYIVYRLLFR